MKASVFPVFSILLLSLALGSSAMAAEDRLNVTSSPFNAIPDDGIDDTAQIMAAINYGMAASKSIYFPAGTYDFKGLMTLQANKSYRLYGEGPGVSTINFSTDGAHPTAGIYAPTMGIAPLNVEGLTLLAQTMNCGTAISASFSEAGASTKFRTATINNVQIIGTTRTGDSGGYWTNGIYLYKAQNSVIDKVHIYGNIRPAAGSEADASLTGIVWESSTDYQTTGLQMSDIEIVFFRTALRTDGWVEGLYMNRFEVVLCGQHGFPAVDLKSVDTHGLDPGYRKPTFHLVNGHVDMMQNGIQLTHLRGVRLSKVNFVHNSAAAVNGAMVILNNCFDATVSQCTFIGGAGLTDESAIRLSDAHHAQLIGNFFDNMGTPSGCIVTQSNSDVVRIINNVFGSGTTPCTGTCLFGPVVNKYDDQNTDPNDPYLRGNYPAP